MEHKLVYDQNTVDGTINAIVEACRVEGANLLEIEAATRSVNATARAILQKRGVDVVGTMTEAARVSVRPHHEVGSINA